MSNDDERLNDERRKLERLFREAAATASQPIADRVELRLRLACRARRRQRRAVRLGWMGAAACLLLVAALGWHVSRQPALTAQSSYAGFLALPYSQSDVPIEQAIVVRVTLRPGDLEMLGLPPAFSTGKQPVAADLLIGQDGMARAVRFTK